MYSLTVVGLDCRRVRTGNGGSKGVGCCGNSMASSLSDSME